MEEETFFNSDKIRDFVHKIKIPEDDFINNNTNVYEIVDRKDINSIILNKNVIKSTITVDFIKDILNDEKYGQEADAQLGIDDYEYSTVINLEDVLERIRESGKKIRSEEKTRKEREAAERARQERLRQERLRQEREAAERARQERLRQERLRQEREAAERARQERLRQEIPQSELIRRDIIEKMKLSPNRSDLPTFESFNPLLVRSVIATVTKSRELNPDISDWEIHLKYRRTINTTDVDPETLEKAKISDFLIKGKRHEARYIF
jgi:multidrug efflux pump subunit AcrA (membrane-fusion protein)